MGYADKLKDLLRPLGVYELHEGAGAAELEALGGAIDGVAALSGETARECTPVTAEGEGLTMLESLFPLSPAGSDAEARRAAIIALLTVNDASFTLAGVNAAISGCGIRAAAAESDVPQTVVVSFPGTRGVPVGFSGMRAVIEDIIPCHLGIEYVFRYVTWQELEALYIRWSDAARMTWEELERVG